jgi:hypothetical protein
MNGREEKVEGKTVCRGCAGEAYYSAADCALRKEWSKAS